MQKRNIYVCLKSKSRIQLYDKPGGSGAIAEGCLPNVGVHSATKDISVLSADVVEADDLFGKLNIVTEITWSTEVGQDVDDVLLPAQELPREGLATLLALLLGGKLDYLDTLLTSLLG
jgi:hypothetical protein